MDLVRQDVLRPGLLVDINDLPLSGIEDLPGGGLRVGALARMSDVFQPNLDFEAANTAAEDGEALIVDIDGYEGPLHVLLALARSQKVDLLKLSVLKLAEQ